MLSSRNQTWSIRRGFARRSNIKDPVISLARKFGLVVATILVYLIAADLVGVAASFFCDVFLSERRTSAALYYVIWFVIGVFCGVLIYVTCGSFTSPEKKGGLMEWGDKGQTGLLIIFTTGAILAGLSILFYRLDWRYSRADSVYVPDSESLTLTLFFTILWFGDFHSQNVWTGTKHTTVAVCARDPRRLR